MTMTKRIAAFLLALVLAMGCLTALAEGDAYPTKWDLTELYASEDEWMADYDAAMELIHAAGYDGVWNCLAQAAQRYCSLRVRGEIQIEIVFVDGHGSVLGRCVEEDQ